MELSQSELALFQDIRTSLNRINSNIESLFFLMYSISAPTGISEGLKVITTAASGSQHLVNAPLSCIGIILTAHKSNQAAIAYGSELAIVDDLTHTHKGGRLEAGESTPLLPINDVFKISITAQEDGDGVSYVYFYKSYEDKDKILAGLIP